MKVGTDGVLLGAWASNPGSSQVLSGLDIGTGTGLLSLMLAQRFPHMNITALEIEEQAHFQAKENFQKSPWSSRLHCLHADFLTWQSPILFDRILSNPPFHTESTQAPGSQRNVARNAAHLPLAKLLPKASTLLKPEGMLYLILPIASEKELLDTGHNHGLYPQKICYLRGQSQSPIKRYLVCLGKQPSTPTLENLIIEQQRHVLTPACASLTRDFYPFLP
jgi:tRNA1Val (adenine37-N6)-methyltransferase